MVNKAHPEVSKELGIYGARIIKGELIGKTWYLMRLIETK